MMPLISSAQWYGMLLAIVGLICSHAQPSRAAETEVAIKDTPIEGHSSNRQFVEQVQFMTRNGSVADDRPQGAAPTVEPGNPLQRIPVTSLTATRERPIFSPTRRPPSRPLPIQVAIAPTIDQGRPNFSLVGAISGEHEDIAILLDETTKVIIRLRTGESHAGWTLQTANGREVTLQKSGKTAVVTLPHAAHK